MKPTPIEYSRSSSPNHNASSRIILIFLWLALVLSACNPATTPPTNTPTATETIAATNSPTPRPTATIKPTKSPTIIPTPILPYLPDLSHSADQYELVEPPIEVLGSILDQAETIRDESSDYYFDQPDLSKSMFSDANLQFDAVIFSLHQQEKQHPLDIDSLLKNIKWGLWVGVLDDPSQDRVDVILNAMTNEIQKQAFHFEDKSAITHNKLSITPHKIELDHDPEAEWLAEVRIAEIGLLSFLLFDENEDGTYRRLESQIPTFTQDGIIDYKVLSLQDFTGDGLTDILIQKYFYIMGSHVAIYYVGQGNKAGMTLINSYSTVGYAYTYEGAIPFQVVDETTLAGLKITYHESINWGCSWEHDITYHWINGVEQKRETAAFPPSTPECQLAKAVNLKDPVDDQTAIQLLISAIHGLDPAKIEKIAFAHYRLALLYLNNNQPTLARKHLDSLQALYANDAKTSEYLKKALTPLLAQPDLNLLPVCQMGYASPQEAFPGWREYAHSTRVYQSYPGGESVPDAVCPLIDIVEAHMDNIDFNGIGSPAEAIQKVGLPIQTIHSYSLPGWDRTSWFAVIDTQPYIVISYVPFSENDEFIWKRMTVFNGGTSLPTWLNQDVTGDGIAELAIAVEAQYYCEVGKDSYILLVTGAIRKNMITSIEVFECFDVVRSLDLAEELKDADGDGLSDLLVHASDNIFGSSDWFDSNTPRNGPASWFTQEEIRNMIWDSGLTGYEDDSDDPEKSIFRGANPVEFRENIQNLLKSLSSDSLYYQPIHDRYLYLIALSLELEGNAQEAVRSYLELAKSSPGTAWSSLAAYRLKLSNTP